VPVDLTVDADPRFSVDLPGSRTVPGSHAGSGTQLELRVSDPVLFVGRSDAPVIRGLAAGLATHGLSITVVAPGGPLVTLGAPRTSWLQQRVTGSRHIRVERGAGLWSLARGRTRASDRGALPTAELAPPTTLFPLAPTFRRRSREAVTTTHGPAGGGNPRLIMAPRPDPWPGDRQEVFRLRGDVTTIGSDPRCDIVLAGLEPEHARVQRDELDEYVLVRLGGPGAVRVNGAPVDVAVLRTATRIRLGGATLSFYREEFADHGRPYGGRRGGEIGHQRPQPGRNRPPLHDRQPEWEHE
jgi:hypothetical protein